MNAKFLFAATLAVSAFSLASTVAMAADPSSPQTRAEVKAQTAQGAAARQGELYGDESIYRATPSTVSRASVLAELAADNAAHPYSHVGQRSDDLPMPYYTSSTLARAEVKADVRHAIADGRLPRNGENDESVTTASAVRSAHQHLALASR